MWYIMISILHNNWKLAFGMEMVVRPQLLIWSPLPMTVDCCCSEAAICWVPTVACLWSSQEKFIEVATVKQSLQYGCFILFYEIVFLISTCYGATSIIIYFGFGSGGCELAKAHVTRTALTSTLFRGSGPDTLMPPRWPMKQCPLSNNWIIWPPAIGDLTWR